MSKTLKVHSDVVRKPGDETKIECWWDHLHIEYLEYTITHAIKERKQPKRQTDYNSQLKALLEAYDLTHAHNEIFAHYRPLIIQAYNRIQSFFKFPMMDETTMNAQCQQRFNYHVKDLEKANRLEFWDSVEDMKKVYPD